MFSSQGRRQQQPPPYLPSQPRTLRLSPLPTSINEIRLRQYLNSLECDAEYQAENILAFSLAPYMNWLVATVTFRQEPSIFAQCRPRSHLPFQLPADLAMPRESNIIIDCDFYGITPLYSPLKPQEPKFE
jgi:hypothetical protein